MRCKLKNRKGEHFGFALSIIFLSMAVSFLAFTTEDNKITGFAASASHGAMSLDLMEFDGVSSLRNLAEGNYYIDNYGLVYWADDESRPLIAKVNYLDDAQKNRNIYIDDYGNIGFVLS